MNCIALKHTKFFFDLKLLDPLKNDCIMYAINIDLSLSPNPTQIRHSF